jgi:type I restriction enzyme M protein
MSATQRWFTSIIAQISGIHDAKTSAATTVYDPTCGSGSLLLKVGDEAGTPVTLYGQEKDAATSGLARMNMILHNNPTALVVQGNTLADPKFKDGDSLKTFDFVVANPPFSDKRWSNGVDHAYLLHIVRSLKRHDMQSEQPLPSRTCARVGPSIPRQACLSRCRT